MSKKHRGIWKDVFRREFTKESILKAARSRDMEDLEEKKESLSVRDSCEAFLDKSRPERFSAYLIMAKEMPNASPGTLRKLRKSLNLEWGGERE